MIGVSFQSQFQSVLSSVKCATVDCTPSDVTESEISVVYLINVVG